MLCYLRPPNVMPLPSEKSFCGFESELQGVVSFRFAVGCQVNAAYSVCDGLATEQHTEGG